MKVLDMSLNIMNKILGKTKSCSVVIVAAGSSKRMDGEDKLFIDINGKPVIIHTLSAFQQCDRVCEIVVAAKPDSINIITHLCKMNNISKVTQVIPGGDLRSESVLIGVNAISKKSSLVAIHDAARPCIESKVISRVINMAAKYKAAAPYIPLTSTIKRVKNGRIVETISREELAQIQTPQVFKTDLIKGALTKAVKNSIPVTDDCMAAELLNIPVYVVNGSVKNIKLTTRDDISLIKAILSETKD